MVAFICLLISSIPGSLALTYCVLPLSCFFGCSLAFTSLRFARFRYLILFHQKQNKQNHCSRPRWSASRPGCLWGSRGRPRSAGGNGRPSAKDSGRDRGPRSGKEAHRGRGRCGWHCHGGCEYIYYSFACFAAQVVNDALMDVCVGGSVCVAPVSQGSHVCRV